jgi:DNA-binding beta-propeller fold protein YncE
MRINTDLRGRPARRVLARRALVRLLLLAGLLSLGLVGAAQAATIYVAALNTSIVSRVDEDTGVPDTPISTMGGTPGDVAFGPEGLLYVANYNRRNVQRYDPLSGDFVDDFSTPGGLPAMPIELEFSPTGDLYLSTPQSNLIARVDGVTGALLGTFGVSGGFPGGLLFHQSGDLLVTNVNRRSIQRYDATTGAYLGDFSPTGSFSAAPGDLVLGPDGNIYVGLFTPLTAGTNMITRVDGASGAVIDMLAVNGGLPGGLAFNAEGDLWVSNYSRRTLQRYDPSSWTMLYEVGSASGPYPPLGLAIIPEPGTALLLAGGLAGLAAAGRRRSRH